VDGVLQLAAEQGDPDALIQRDQPGDEQKDQQNRDEPAVHENKLQKDSD
jgi:hypothetical protein